MSVEIRYGDLLEYEGRYICQGVNTLGLMGAGVALSIRERYPKVYEVYSSKNLKLGDAFGVDCGKHIVLNIATQSEIGRWKKPFNYKAFEVGLKKITEVVQEPIAFPRIGADLAGGDWFKIEPIIETICKNAIVYYLNDEVPF